MKKPATLLFIGSLLTVLTSFAQSTVVAGRMKELFLKTDLISSATNFNDPWEVTYGPDDSLWITEAKGYYVRKVHPVNGGYRTVLDLRNTAAGSTFTPSTYRRQFSSSQNPWPQGGMMGLAIHPDFNHPTAPKKYVYLSYVRSYVGNDQTYNGEFVDGQLFWTWLVRFEYINGRLASPVTLCDTIRGSNDHNSGRMVIAPVNGVNYLFYAVGDMGGGQFDNHSRVNKAQWKHSYEGKILRFNLEEDGDADQGTVDYNRWIPNDNPFNTILGRQSAVWSTGIRNNQGFVYNPNTGKLYGSSHGPHSDDEINIIEEARNYGHPVVIGMKNDNNYVSSSAGKPGSSLPVISDEVFDADSIGVSYKDPLFTAYASTQSEIYNIYTGNISNNGVWPSEGWSGLDMDTSTIIPGGKNSLLAASLKWGRIVRIRVNEAGDAVQSVGGADTTSYFGSRNRFRDLALSPDGRSWFVVMDRSTTTSGPSAGNPIVSNCQGCVQRYTFLGYERDRTAGANEKSTIPTSIPVTTGTPNGVAQARTITINTANSNDTVWVPFNGPDGNIMAEVKAKMGSTAANNLGNTSVALYRNTNAVREDASKRLFLDRNFRISFQNTPTNPVAVRLYFTKAELDALIAATNTGGTGSGVSDVNSLLIRVNNDAIGSSLTASTDIITPTIREEFGANQSYVVQFNLEAPFASAYTFYLGNPNSTLPLNLLTFRGNMQASGKVLLQWQTTNEVNSKEFQIERSLDGNNYETLGIVDAKGNTETKSDYNYVDIAAGLQSSNTLYYRLKMLDLDGAYKYSSVIVINVPYQPGKVVIVPNPVVSSSTVKAHITSGIDTRVKWMLADNSGRIVLESSAQVRKGNNVVDINVSQLKAGIYFLVVKGEGIDQRVKMQKL